MTERRARWRHARPILLAVAAVLALKLIYFAALQQQPPDRLQDNPEGLSIEFSVDRRAVLTLDECVSGSWLIQGETEEIRVNGGDWNAPAAGNYKICNRADLSPTLELRLPSTAIASYRLEVTVIFGEGLHLAGVIALVFCAIYVLGVNACSHRRLVITIAAFHIAVVLFYQATGDLSISHLHNWGASYHSLPLPDLRHNLWESFLYLHYQPPFFSVYGLALDALWPGPAQDAMYIVQVLLGMLMCLMSYAILWHFSGNKTFAFSLGLLLAFNPAYILFEALSLYSILSAFLILSAAFCLLQFQRLSLDRFLYLFIFCLNLLILTRSVYHIALLIPALTLLWLLLRRNRARVLVGSLLICLLSFGWYGKNLLVNGSFSSSSSLGMSLWNVARSTYDVDELVALFKQGVLADRLPIWYRHSLPPSAYPGYAPLDNGIPILSGDNANNAVYLELQKLYLDSALQLIRHDPLRYIKGTIRAYGYYSCPSSTWDAFDRNLAAMSASHQALSVRLLQMQGAAQQVGPLLGLSWDEFGVCSNLYIIMPMLVLGAPLYLAWRYRRGWERWRKRLRRDSALVFIWAMVAYTAIVTSLLETFENARYKFMIEIPLYIFIAVVAFRIAKALRRRLMERADPTPTAT